eukprot:TRINITY_DN1605_c0_g1_i7.p1 TRINITY_DN1605_c0_g1~~TRINITY_DN1605_c0_g1_i7.p1  ORF type:complete len:2557 (-),score=707.41 TRINITY_DN1605_c0_g1_i7:133-7803(-)
MEELSEAQDAGEHIIQLLDSELNLPSSKRREQLLEQLLRDQDTIGDQEKEAAAALINTLYHYHERKSYLQVEKVVLQLSVKNATFFKAFVSQLMKVLNSPIRYSNLRSQVKLFRWTCIVLQSCEDTLEPLIRGSNNTPFVLLANNQINLLSMISSSSKRSARNSAFSMFLETLNKKPLLLENYVQLLSSKEPTLELSSIVGLLFDHLTKRVDLLPKYRQQFIEWYSKILLSATQKPTEQNNASFVSLVKTINEKEFKDTILPTLQRVLKRNPEVVTKSVADLLRDINFDLSAHATDVLSLILPQMQSKDEALRDVGMSAYKNLLRKVGANVLESVLNDLLKALKSKPPYWYERLATAQAIQFIGEAELGASKNNSKLATIASSGLADYLDTEASEEARFGGLIALGRWIAQLEGPSFFPEKAVKILTGGVQTDKEASKLGALECLNIALPFVEPKFATSLLPHLFKLVKNTKTGADGIFALRVLARLSATDKSVAEKMNSEKIWGLVLKSDSFLHKQALLSRLAERDLQALAQLFEVIYLNHLSNLKSEEVGSVLNTTLFLLTNASLLVRRAASQSVRNAHANVKVSDLLLGAFKNLLVQNAASPTFLPNRKAYSSALIAIVSPSTTQIPLAFLLAHHAFVASDPKIFWRHVLKRKRSEDPTGLLRENAESTASYLLGEEGIQSEAAHLRDAAISSFGSLARYTDETFLRFIVPPVIEILRTNRTKVLALTPVEVGIYTTPEGEIFQKDYAENAATAKKTTNANQQQGKQTKQKGESGFKRADEEKWEKQLREELEKKKQAAAGSKVDEKAKEEQLERERVVRRRISPLVSGVTVPLQVLSVVSRRNPKGSHQYLNAATPAVLSVLPISFVSEEAVLTLRSLSRCLVSKIPSFDNLAYDIANALGHLYKNTITSEDLFASFLESSVIPLEEKLENPMTGPSFSFCFPLCRSSFSRSLPVPIQEAALQLIERHTSPGPEFPRADMIETLIHVMATLPRFHPRAKQALFNLCAGVDDTQRHDATTSSPSIVALLQGLISPHAYVRIATLSAMSQIPAIQNGTLPAVDDVSATLWFSKFDTEPEAVPIADKIWGSYGHSLTESYMDLLPPLLANFEQNVQEIAARSIAGAVKEKPETSQSTLSKLLEIYSKNSVEDEKEETRTKINSRRGVALAIGACASELPPKEISLVFTFLLGRGLSERNEEVRQKFVQAGLDVIQSHGESQAAVLFPFFENYLNRPDNATQDRVRESVVIFVGTLAKHLGPADPKVGQIVDKLIDTLRTPSESVQKAVSKCLVPLLPHVQDRAESLAKLLLERNLSGENYGERRGAAYGIAAFVKGFGISSLKKYNIITSLQDAVEDKRHPNARQGALFSFETLCTTLERLFEPYVIQILPKLLSVYGDTSVDVRDATADTSRAIMSQLSAHGIKLVLPALLKALHDRNWRTKSGSVQLIGSMAFCAPRQLSSCLPAIVPKLAEVLTDSHPAVVESAREALNQVGSVIRNPEVQVHVPVLISAIDDPDTWSRDALDALIHTNFVHTIDSPSLSLIIPTLHRALRDRSTETKKRATQIVGNMSSLTEQKDLEPYLEQLVADLKTVILDPIPETRAIAAKAIGTLVKGLGEEKFSDMIPWCLEVMRSEMGSVERSGAAQTLSEILAALDLHTFENLLPDVLNNTNHVKSHVREGFIGLFVFLPTALTVPLQNHLGEVLPCILKGLADETEPVREISLRAGQSIVNQYASTSLPLLLPAIEDGLFHENWRIRQSSVQLLGDLLYRIVSKNQTEEQDPGKIVTIALGSDRKNAVLAALYLIRSDVSSVVRQKALVVWKQIVTNTPKTLREITPVLMNTIIDSLGSSNVDRRQVSGKTLGDLVQKLGDKILPEIVPILENGLNSDRSETRQGVCLGLREVMNSIDRTELVKYVDVINPSIRKALCDPLPDVREAAAHAFDVLYKNVGNAALDEILPPLLHDLPDETTHAMEGLKELLAVRSNVILPFLVPKLLTPPITAFNVKSLASVAEVAGPSLNQHVPTLVQALIDSVSASSGEEIAQVRKSAETIILSVEESGIHLLIGELVQHLNDKTPKSRAVAINLIESFCSSARVNYEAETSYLIENLLDRFDDESKEVQSAAWGALGAVTGSIKKESVGPYVPIVLRTLASLKDHLEKKGEKELPGFCLPKGLSPILPIFLNGLMYGSPDNKSQSANGLGDLIEMTSEEALKPFVIQITGPLIRVVGDRFSFEVKAAILQTLNLLLGKGGPTLKPFVTQLQTTFIKSLSDPNRTVRVQAANALGRLMSILATRIDSLVTELLGGIGAADGGVQEAMLTALREVILRGGKTVSAPVMAKSTNSLVELLGSDEESTRNATAKTLGAFSKFVGEESRRSLLNDYLLSDQPKSWQLRHGCALTLTAVLKQNRSEASFFSSHETQIVSHLLKLLKDEKSPIRQSACEAIGEILVKPEAAESDLFLKLITPLSELLNDESNDVKIAALKVIKQSAKKFPSVTKEHLGMLVPKVFTRVKERSNLPVKLAAERTLLHLLQIHIDPNTLTIYSETLDQTN